MLYRPLEGKKHNPCHTKVWRSQEKQNSARQTSIAMAVPQRCSQETEGERFEELVAH